MSCIKGVKPPYTFERELDIVLKELQCNKASSLVEAEISGFLSNCDRDHGVPIEFQQGSQASSHFDAWNCTFLSSCKRGVGLMSSSGGILGLFLELKQGSQTTLRVVRVYSSSSQVCTGQSGLILS